MDYGVEILGMKPMRQTITPREYAAEQARLSMNTHRTDSDRRAEKEELEIFRLMQIEHREFILAAMGIGLGFTVLMSIITSIFCYRFFT